MDNVKEKNRENKIEAKNIIKQIIYTLFVVCILSIIFMFSNEAADESSQTSGGLIEAIVKIIIPNATEEQLAKKVEIFQPIIRKCAHFTLYASLGFFTYNLVRTRKKNIFKDKENTPKIYGIITQVFGTLYAISDEIHQTFIPGRSGEIRDVIIDSLGIFTGLLICIVFLKLVHKFIDKLKQKRKIKDKNNLE